MNINHLRLENFFTEMSKIGKIGETGTNRPAHSPDEKSI
jgi:allantoate deiminase/N-carbamoyl-L-amino-acid hydrolase